MIVWDAKHEYAGQIVRTTINLLATLRETGRSAARIVYRPARLSDFSWWCQCAYAWAVQHGAASIIAEETADVTSPGKAPDAWGVLLRRVRCTGSAVYAVTQRPAESDKTAIGNASLIHCGRLSRDQDRAYMAREISVEKKIIADLRPFEYIERDERGKFSRGVTKRPL